MHKIGLIWILMLGLATQLLAVAPAIPLEISMAKAQAVTYEGDPIYFNVTLKNTDPARTLPVIVPTGQAGYNKVFYFKIYDAAENQWLQRWVESREVTMSQQTPHLPTLYYLKPGEKVVFSANLNDFQRSFTMIESNHMISTPMFAGRYKVFLIYDPTGNPIGDTLYNYYDNPIDEHQLHRSNRLDFPIYGYQSQPFMLDVLKSNKSMITFQNWMYACNRKPNTDIWEYSRDGQILRLIEVKQESANSSYEAEIDPDTKKILRAFRWFPNHEVQEFRDYGIPPCNATRYEVRMQNATLRDWSYSLLPSGKYLLESYDAEGLLAYSFLYQPGSTQVTYTTYKVKRGAANPAKSETWTIALPFDPCSFVAKP